MSSKVIYLKKPEDEPLKIEVFQSLLEEIKDISDIRFVRRSTFAKLTAIERKVAVMLGRGMTFREIAFDMDRTDSHIHRVRTAILRKLWLQSNSQLVLYLIKIGVVKPADCATKLPE